MSGGCQGTGKWHQATTEKSAWRLSGKVTTRRFLQPIAYSQRLFDLILFDLFSLSQLVGCRGAGISHGAEGDATRQHRYGHSAPVGHGNMVGDEQIPLSSFLLAFHCGRFPSAAFHFLLSIGCVMGAKVRSLFEFRKQTGLASGILKQQTADRQ